jgi:hypothetical protein
VRYALHRFFSRQGLVVKGIDPAAGAWNDTSPVGLLRDQVPAYVEGSLEERLADKGYGLHELAMITATLQHLFSTEAIKRLEAAYELVERPIMDVVGPEEIFEILDKYMAIYILEGVSERNEDAVQRVPLVHQYYPGWHDTQTWLHDARRNMAFAQRNTINPFISLELDFADALDIVEEVNEQYGVFQDFECQELKEKLLDIEHGSTGRVRLADFYHKALDGHWQFSENVEYLREAGSLDESDPDDPRVIMTNYLYSKGNCVAKSSYYSVCCINQCESLLEHVERKLQASFATPQELATIVSHISSSTVPAPRNLSLSLMTRLEQVAATNGGTVPVHGRLFMQWMHFAYPRECPYPHLSGTTSSLTYVEWEQQGGLAQAAPTSEMEKYAKRASWNNPDIRANLKHEGISLEELLPWSNEEELLQPMSLSGDGHASGWIRYFVSLAAIAAMVLSVLRVASPFGLFVEKGREVSLYV